MSVAPDERLLNLLVALTHARVRMTRGEIRRTVTGYELPPEGASAQEISRADAAFERMFERDKEALRTLGVHLITVTDATHGDDIGYRIETDDAAIPELDLTPAERAVIGLAAGYWREATLGATAAQAVTKVAATGRIDEPAELPFAGVSRVLSVHLDTLVDAIDQRMTVRFTYASASSGTTTRTVDPYRVVLSGTRQYVVGWDHDREAIRMFRLARIEGKVARASEPGAFESRELGDDLQRDLFEPVEVEIAVLPETCMDLRTRGAYLRSVGDWDVYRVAYDGPGSVRDDVMRRRGRARVVAPQEIADEVSREAGAVLEVLGG